MLLLGITLSAFWVGCSEDDDQTNKDISQENTRDSVTCNKISMVVTVSGDTPVKLGVYGKGDRVANLSIDWGDGSVSSGEFDINEEHVYQDAKEYTITISGNDISGFNCPNLNIVSLDLTKCPGLTSLICYNSNLKNLDLSENKALVNLCCNVNQLTTLDTRNATELEYVDCSVNQLISIDISRNTKLKYFNCNDNELTILNTSNNIELNWLYCLHNNIESLDFTNNTRVRQIYCAGNGFSDETYDIIYTSLPIVNDNEAIFWGDGGGDRSILEGKGWSHNQWS